MEGPRRATEVHSLFRFAGRLTALALAAFASSGCGSLEAAPLRADFQPLSFSPRSKAPAFVDVKLHWQGPGLLQGVLELVITDRGQRILTQRSQELTLSSGTQRVPLLVPPFAVQVFRQNMEVELRFVTGRETLMLGTFPWSGGVEMTRQFLIAHCGGRRQVEPDSPPLWHALRFEQIPVHPSRRFTPGTSIGTSGVALEVEDLPSMPLALCAFDLVVLEGTSFSQLREKQLLALARWVEGGGSLYVVPSGALQAAHLRFLNQLVGGPGRSPFSLDVTGRAVSSVGDPVHVRSELGRCVIAARPPTTTAEFASAEWQENVEFLWRSPKGGPAFSNAGERAANLQGFQEQLLPQTARLIPVPVLCGMLAGFLLLIGPAEWFGLGAIRRRRWTWITFPISTTALTAATIWTAEAYLGTADHRTSVSIIDVGKGGRFLREHKLEVIFAGREREVVTEMRHGLVVPIVTSSTERLARSEGQVYEGQVPARALMRQTVRQWVPQVNRSLSFEAPAMPSDIRWDAVSAAELLAIKATAKLAVDRSNVAGLLTGVGDPSEVFRAATGLPARYEVGVIHARHRQPEVTSQRSGTRGFLRETCLMPQLPKGTVVTAISPSGAASLEDLALYDPSDPDEVVVLVVEEKPTGIQIFRRKYRTDD